MLKNLIPETCTRNVARFLGHVSYFLFSGTRINQSNQSIIATSRLNCYSNIAARQSVKDRSDDEVLIHEEPCVDMLTE